MLYKLLHEQVDVAQPIGNSLRSYDGASWQLNPIGNLIKIPPPPPIIDYSKPTTTSFIDVYIET
jgi:hypothetical protein